jgi:acetyl-CoA carboxylase carboxyl transferase subunit beta
MNIPWYKRQKDAIVSKPVEKKVDVPPGGFTKCKKCAKVVVSKAISENQMICPECSYYYPLPARERIRLTVDPDSFKEYDREMSSADPLDFVDTLPYPVRKKRYTEKSREKDAVITGNAKIFLHPVNIGVMHFDFMGGSMGSVVGEKLARMIEQGLEQKTPVIIISISGGARMQEGILSLMQMAKTSGALARLAKAELPYISVLTNPDYAGVMASYASLGDVIVAEKGCLVGFAGPRVIEQTIRQKLPEGFQSAEFVQNCGFIDVIVAREEMRDTLGLLLGLLMEKKQ